MSTSSLTSTLGLAEIVELHDTFQPTAVFHIAPQARDGRWQVAPLPAGEDSKENSNGWWAIPTSLCGDAPDKYHSKYLVAVLSSGVADNGEQVKLGQLEEYTVPRIDFTTEEFTRRSMTLNGMRMSTEYFATGSRRVLQLVAQRLAAQQRDVAHDILVYLMQQVLDTRSAAREARLLRAEAVAAYLGLEQKRVNLLFLEEDLQPTHIAKQIIAGFAGPLRRPLNVPSLIEQQVLLAQPALQHFAQQEQQIFSLLDEVVQLLYEH